MSNLKVIKLGGTSQTSIGYSNLSKYLDNEKKYIIVVSAIKNITNILVKFSEKPIKEQHFYQNNIWTTFDLAEGHYCVQLNN